MINSEKEAEAAFMFGSAGRYKVTEWTKVAESWILFGCREHSRMAGEELHNKSKMLMMSGGKKKRKKQEQEKYLASVHWYYKACSAYHYIIFQFKHWKNKG